jgi:hypothetical protein
MFAVPIEIFIIESDNRKVTYGTGDLDRILDAVNSIWRRNANITFEVVEINRIVVPDNRSEPAKSNEDLEALGRDFLGANFFDSTIDVIIVKSFRDSENGGGIAHESLKAVMQNEFDDERWANWNLAHELGHKLNLVDVFQHDNLMQADEYPWNIIYKILYIPTGLTNEQILTARDWTYETYCPEDSGRSLPENTITSE